MLYQSFAWQRIICIEKDFTHFVGVVILFWMLALFSGADIPTGQH